MKKTFTLTAALGSAFITTAALSLPAAAADAFGATPLRQGYQLAQADTKAPEGKCGTDKKVADDGKKADGSCGAEKKVEKKKDGKCGEGKCGANKKKQ